jgi:hypothetical protein
MGVPRVGVTVIPSAGAAGGAALTTNAFEKANSDKMRRGIHTWRFISLSFPEQVDAVPPQIVSAN